MVVSASGDRSIRLWDAESGALLYCFEYHHHRGYVIPLHFSVWASAHLQPRSSASIDFAPPYILSGSSDNHLRFFNVVTSHGWSTSPHYERCVCTTPPSTVCRGCGGDESSDDTARRMSIKAAQAHRGLVRSVALGDQYVVSGSYDQTIKVRTSSLIFIYEWHIHCPVSQVWDRATGELIADLKGGHSGKICSVGFDCTKVSVSDTVTIQAFHVYGGDCIVWGGSGMSLLHPSIPLFIFMPSADLYLGLCTRNQYVFHQVVAMDWVFDLLCFFVYITSQFFCIGRMFHRLG
jgi:WD40 repeat protein